MIDPRLTHEAAVQALAAELRDAEDPYVAMGIGIPGSGKSTVLAELADNLDVKRISPDDIREEISGDAADQSVSKEAWEEARRRVKEELAAGRSVIIDATHSEAFRRKEAIELYRSLGANAVIGAFFDTPLDTAKDRNSRRDRVVPEFVLDKMHASIQDQLPSESEGFEKVVNVPPTK